jgi:acyl carrier protein
MEDKLIAIVATALEIPASKITLDTGPDDLKKWDSIAHINIVSEVEAEFGVNIPIEKIPEIQTVRDFLPYLGKR